MPRIRDQSESRSTHLHQHVGGCPLEPGSGTRRDRGSRSEPGGGHDCHGCRRVGGLHDCHHPAAMDLLFAADLGLCLTPMARTQGLCLRSDAFPAASRPASMIVPRTLPGGQPITENLFDVALVLIGGARPASDCARASRSRRTRTSEERRIPLVSNIGRMSAHCSTSAPCFVELTWVVTS